LYAQKLQKFSDRLIDKIKTDLEVDGDFAPTLIVFRNGGKNHETIDLPFLSDEGDESKMVSVEQMADASRIILEKSTEEGVDAEVVVTRVSITEDDSEASDAIHVTVYLKDGSTYAHMVLFSRSQDNTLAISDRGWDEVTSSSEELENPWKKVVDKPS